MRVMVIVKASKSSEAGVMPTERPGGPISPPGVSEHL
jgi:hypothetical protein